MVRPTANDLPVIKYQAEATVTGTRSPFKPGGGSPIPINLERLAQEFCGPLESGRYKGKREGRAPPLQRIAGDWARDALGEAALVPVGVGRGEIAGGV